MMWGVEFFIWILACYAPKKLGSYSDGVSRFLMSSLHCCPFEEEAAVLLLVQAMAVPQARLRRIEAKHLGDWREGPTLITHILRDCWKAVIR